MLLMHHTETYDLQIKLFCELPEESRLADLEALRQDPTVLGRIVNTIGPPRSNTSSHLPCLHGRGFVAAKQGCLGRYSLIDDRFEALLQLADNLVGDARRRVYTCTSYSEPPRRNITSNAREARRRGKR